MSILCQSDRILYRFLFVILIRSPSLGAMREADSDPRLLEEVGDLAFTNHLGLLLLIGTEVAFKTGSNLTPYSASKTSFL